MGGASGIAFDGDGNVYVADCGSQIDKIDVLGLLTVVRWRRQPFLLRRWWTGSLREIYCPQGLAFDRDGNLYLADSLNNRIRRIDRSGIITTVAGSGPVPGNVATLVAGGFSGDGGPATSAQLNDPLSVAFDTDGNMAIADGIDNRIRKVDRQGSPQSPVLEPMAFPGMAARRRPLNLV